MHGGVKVYRGTAAAARNYLDADRSRADDYYLAEGTGIARRFVTRPDGPVVELASLTGDGYEAWVAGVDPETGQPRGRLRADASAVRFVEVVVNGPEAHLVLTDTTTAAAAYVAMTRGHQANTAHLVAANLDDACDQWIAAFCRDRADLGPAAAGQAAARAAAGYRTPRPLSEILAELRRTAEADGPNEEQRHVVHA